MGLICSIVNILSKTFFLILEDNNIDVLFAVIHYKKVPTENITYISSCEKSLQLAKHWGCNVQSLNTYTDENVQHTNKSVIGLLNATKLRKKDKKQLLEFLAKMKKFRNTISNVPYNKRDGHSGGSTSGTAGDTQIGRKLNKLQVELTEPGGNIAQMGLKSAMMRDSLNNPNMNPKIVSLMTDKDWWKFNTFWVYGVKEDNQQCFDVYQPDILSSICAKVINVSFDENKKFENFD